MKAIINGTIVAESDSVLIVEGNHYFPPGSIKKEVLTASETRTNCPWKGSARFFHFNNGGNIVKDAAWTYENPEEPARHLMGYLAFWPQYIVVD